MDILWCMISRYVYIFKLKFVNVYDLFRILIIIDMICKYGLQNMFMDEIFINDNIWFWLYRLSV